MVSSTARCASARGRPVARVQRVVVVAVRHGAQACASSVKPTRAVWQGPAAGRRLRAMAATMASPRRGGSAVAAVAAARGVGAEEAGRTGAAGAVARSSRRRSRLDAQLLPSSGAMRSTSVEPRGACADRVGQQVGQRALDQRLVDRGLRITLDAHGQVASSATPSWNSPPARPAPPGWWRARRAVAPRSALREEQHVVDHRRQALRLLRQPSMVSRSSSAGRSRDSATSVWLISAASGARSSCATSALKAFSSCDTACSSRSISVELLDPGQQFLGRVGRRRWSSWFRSRWRASAPPRVQRLQRARAHASAGGHQHAGQQGDHHEHRHPVAAERGIAAEVHRSASSARRRPAAARGCRSRWRRCGRHRVRTAGRRRRRRCCRRATARAACWRASASARTRAGRPARRRSSTRARGSPPPRCCGTAPPAVLLLHQHLHRHPGAGEQQRQHHHGDDGQLARQAPADRVAAQGVAMAPSGLRARSPAPRTACSSL